MSIRCRAARVWLVLLAVALVALLAAAGAPAAAGTAGGAPATAGTAGGSPPAPPAEIPVRDHAFALYGGWQAVRFPDGRTAQRSTGAGAWAQVEFTGTRVSVTVAVADQADFRWRVDSGPWRGRTLTGSGAFVVPLADGLAPGRHTLELRPGGTGLTLLGMRPETVPGPPAVLVDQRFGSVALAWLPPPSPVAEYEILQYTGADPVPAVLAVTRGLAHVVEQAPRAVPLRYGVRARRTDGRLTGQTLTEALTLPASGGWMRISGLGGQAGIIRRSAAAAWPRLADNRAASDVGPVQGPPPPPPLAVLPGTLGMALLPGDRIVVSPEGWLEIEVDGGTYVRADGGTDLTLGGTPPPAPDVGDQQAAVLVALWNLGGQEELPPEVREAIEIVGRQVGAAGTGGPAVSVAPGAAGSPFIVVPCPELDALQAKPDKTEEEKQFLQALAEATSVIGGFVAPGTDPAAGDPAPAEGGPAVSVPPGAAGSEFIVLPCPELDALQAKPDKTEEEKQFLQALEEATSIVGGFVAPGTDPAAANPPPAPFKISVRPVAPGGVVLAVPQPADASSRLEELRSIPEADLLPAQRLELLDLELAAAKQRLRDLQQRQRDLAAQQAAAAARRQKEMEALVRESAAVVVPGQPDYFTQQIENLYAQHAAEEQQEQAAAAQVAAEIARAEREIADLERQLEDARQAYLEAQRQAEEARAAARPADAGAPGFGINAGLNFTPGLGLHGILSPGAAPAGGLQLAPGPPLEISVHQGDVGVEVAIDPRSIPYAASFYWTGADLDAVRPAVPVLAAQVGPDGTASTWVLIPGITTLPVAGTVQIGPGWQLDTGPGQDWRGFVAAPGDLPDFAAKQTLKAGLAQNRQRLLAAVAALPAGVIDQALQELADQGAQRLALAPRFRLVLVQPGSGAQPAPTQVIYDSSASDPERQAELVRRQANLEVQVQTLRQELAALQAEARAAEGGQQQPASPGAGDPVLNPDHGAGAGFGP